MPNPVLPFTPWSGGLHIRQHPSLAPANKLLIADDVVYDFDGTKKKRGGQSHRNRIPIMGGVVDDHFTKEPPGDWDLSSADFALVHVEDTIWQGATDTGTGVTLRKGYSEQLPAALSLRLRVVPADVVVADNYFRISIDPGTATGLYRLNVQFSGEGIKLETASGVFDLITSSNGTWAEFNLDTYSGRELYETDVFHVWRFDISATQQVTMYFDETKIWTSNDGLITTLGTAGTVAQAEIEWVSAGQLDFSIDYMEVGVEGGEEDIVTCLADYPRISSGIIAPTVHRMAAIVNGRVFIDPGDHEYQLILDNYVDVTVKPRTICDFACFNSFLIIARMGSHLYKWDGTLTFAQVIEDSPIGSLLRVHADRLWVAGNHNSPSRIYFSGYLNEEVWTTESGGDFADSGFIDIDPEDGGIISGIGPSFHGDLIVYKTTGIYRIQGTDVDSFVMQNITKALGGASHHAIQNVGNDQYFVSTFGVHSLLTTQKFGDFEGAFLSNDLRDLWNGQVNPNYLQYSWAYNNEPLDRYELLVSSSIDADDTGIFPNRVFVLHYAVTNDDQQAGAWSIKRIGGGSAIMYTDEDGIRHGFIGGDDGYVNRQDEQFTFDFPIYFASPASVVGGTGTQNLFIMRHLASEEILTWESLPYFDGVIYNLQYNDLAHIAALQAIVAANRRWWRYYTVLDYPYSGTLFGGTSAPLAEWFNYLRDNIQFTGTTSHRRFRVSNTVALFEGTPAGDGQQRELIPWGEITSGERALLISEMVSLALAPGGVSVPASGIFLDQSWLNLEEFFVESNASAVSGHGNIAEGSPKLTALNYAGTESAFGDGGLWTTHRAALVAFYSELATALGSSRYVIKNGDHRTISGDTIPKPWMLENAWDNNIDGGTHAVAWPVAQAHFATDSRNILSIVCSAADNSTIGVPEALQVWQEVGGWISFTDDDSPEGIANRELAYAQAATILASYGWPT